LEIPVAEVFAKIACRVARRVTLFGENSLSAFQTSIQARFVSFEPALASRRPQKFSG
jgi:hypothetical protein